ncbi:MAG: YggS family pyridoxal phosphate-dependent enzyme [Sphaerochaetaceae bacterium]|jgi:pyridoxal phosphate enzyme (YggS family)
MRKRVETLLFQIEEAKKKAHRTDTVQLMAVSKTQSQAAIIEMIDCGVHLLGENRVQEIEQKFPLAQRRYDLHLIGHLQSNKVKKAVSLVDAIDSVDSLKLLRLINKVALSQGKVMPILFEINTSGEASKIGFTDEKAYFSAVEAAADMPGVRVEGLMTVGPLGSDEKKIRKAFSSLKELQQKSSSYFDPLTFKTLSMGMSDDYLWAIMEGATIVRIGTALFGQRQV